MRKKIKAPRLRQIIAPGVAQSYQAGQLTPEQYRNLRHRGDLLAMVGDRLAQVFTDDAQRRQAWHDHAVLFSGVTNPGTRPPAFWQCEVSVPDRLRDLPAVQSYGSIEEAASGHGRLSRERRQWLLEHPQHLREGEAAVIRRLLLPSTRKASNGPPQDD